MRTFLPTMLGRQGRVTRCRTHLNRYYTSPCRRSRTCKKCSRAKSPIRRTRRLRPTSSMTQPLRKSVRIWPRLCLSIICISCDGFLRSNARATYRCGIGQTTSAFSPTLPSSSHFGSTLKLRLAREGQPCATC